MLPSRLPLLASLVALVISAARAIPTLSTADASTDLNPLVPVLTSGSAHTDKHVLGRRAQSRIILDQYFGPLPDCFYISPLFPIAAHKRYIINVSSNITMAVVGVTMAPQTITRWQYIFAILMLRSPEDFLDADPERELHVSEGGKGALLRVVAKYATEGKLVVGFVEPRAGGVVAIWEEEVEAPRSWWWWGGQD